MSGLDGQSKNATSPTTEEPKPASTTTDPKVIAAYVCFGVGAFIIIIAVIIIVVYLYVRRRRARKKEQLQRSLCLDDYKFPGSGYQLPISTISGANNDDDDRFVRQTEFPDYDFTGNGYRFPLTLSTDKRSQQRHPVDDDNDGGGVVVTSLPVRHSNVGRKSIASTASSSGYSGGGSGGEGNDPATDTENGGYVRLHRSSPLAGINAIYNAGGELNGPSPGADDGTHRGSFSSSSVESRPSLRPTPRAFERRRIGAEDGGNMNRTSVFRRSFRGNNNDGVARGGVSNDGFVFDEDFGTLSRGASFRRSAEAPRRTQLPVTRPSRDRRHSVLLDNVTAVGDCVYHVNLRHDGSSVTQARVVKHPT